MTRRGAAAAPRCLVAALGDDRLQGVHVGLQLTAQSGEAYFAEIDPKGFPCCGGSGIFERREQNALVRCDLTWRLQRVREILARQHQVWGTDPEGQAFKVADLLPARVMTKLKSCRDLRGKRPVRGLVANAVCENKPGSLWAVAIAAAWRFGMVPHLVTLGKTPEQDLLPRERPGDGGRQVILLVEGVARLWDQAVAFDFDLLVAYADRAGYSLWMDVAAQTPEPASSAASMGAASGKFSTRGAFAAKLKAIKNQSLREFLPAETLSRLESVCDLSSLVRLPVRRGRESAVPSS